MTIILAVLPFAAVTCSLFALVAWLLVRDEHPKRRRWTHNRGQRS